MKPLPHKKPGSQGAFITRARQIYSIREYQIKALCCCPVETGKQHRHLDRAFVVCLISEAGHVCTPVNGSVPGKTTALATQYSKIVIL
jgi:hypothetical protein